MCCTFRTDAIQESPGLHLVYPQQGDYSSGPPGKTRLRVPHVSCIVGSGLDPHTHDVYAMFASGCGRHACLRVPDDSAVLLANDILAVLREADYAQYRVRNFGALHLELEWMSVCHFVSQHVRLSVRPSVRPPVCPSLRPSISQSFCQLRLDCLYNTSL